MDKGLKLAADAVGTRTELARRLGITPEAIFQWSRIPLRRVLDVEKATKVPRELLRPDFFRRSKAS
jgi:DNA-binding transcriptional regulator YdaS (Cro superfamily)